MYIRDLAGLQVQVTVMASYGIISLGKNLTHNCLSQLGSINEYLDFDWETKRPLDVTDISHWGPRETSGAHTSVGFTSRCSCEYLAQLQRLLAQARVLLSSAQEPAVSWDVTNI